ncbi:MAG TPA: hypothetical protein VFT05_05255 [Burkholderiaceae bacterium]|nr:hypothetical protein [Burkholderiaceae bacterium]
MNATLAKRALGAMFFSGFGAAWLVLWSRRALHGQWWPIAAIVAAGLALCLGCWRIYRANRAALETEAGTPAEKRRSRAFNVINIVQWVAILVGCNVLANIGLLAWTIPLAVCIVGLHFLPLARLFSYRPHYVTGLALVLLSVLVPVLAGAPDTPVVCLGAGLVLWASALWAVSYGAARQPVADI